MAQDKVGVANLALLKCGAKRITSFNENSDEARAVITSYDDMRDEVLCEHPWGMAQKRAALALLSITPELTEDGMIYVYAKPTDLLAINFTSDASATVKLENDGILSDTPSLKIQYTMRLDDPTKYFSLFTSALATRLAAEMAFSLTESVKKAQALMEEYEKVRLPRAVSKDSQQSSPVQAIQNEWFIARIQSGSQFPAQQPGAQTWHPNW